MKTLKFYVSALFIATIVLASFPSCTKKGTDDPVVSLKTIKDRFTNTWTLNKLEKNGNSQDISGNTYIYTANNNGTLTQTIEGSFFGFPTRTVKEGTWVFINDDEDVQINIASDITIYNIQRLATKELWLIKTVDSDTYVYYFNGL